MDPLELKRTTLSTAEHPFVVCRGDRISSIHDLANCIDSLSQDEFSYHVSPGGKNHIAVWVKEVLRNEVLAHDLNYPVNLSDRTHFAKTIRDHVRWLESV